MALSDLRTRSETRPWGFNVIGYISSTLGLAVAARNTLRTLLELGMPVSTHDVSSMIRHGAGMVTDFDHLRAGDCASGFGVNLFHMNPPEILRLTHEAPPWLDMRNRLNICVPFWELPRFPRPWLSALRAMDAILAPTRFILRTSRRDVPNVPSFHFPQAVFLPEDVRADRSRWGIPAKATLFVTSFDANSDFERKNPWAAIDAFDRAFPPPAPDSGDGGPLLAVKVVSRDLPKGQEHLLKELHTRVEASPRVRLIQEDLTYSDVLCLYASSDAIVSLHRSEGLGLVLMEAMALGKPVIATGWSGNMDFMTEANSFPVPYSLVPARGSQTQYSSLYVGRNVQWAEPDIDAAADRMRLVAGRAGLAEGIGSNAARAMRLRRKSAARTAFLEEVRCLYEEFARPVAAAAPGARAPSRLYVGTPGTTLRNARIALLPTHYAGYRASAKAFSSARGWKRSVHAAPGGRRHR